MLIHRLEADGRADQSRMFEVMGLAVDQLNDNIDRIVLYETLAHGLVKEKIEKISIGRFLNDLQRQIESAFTARSPKVEFDCECQGKPISGSPNALSVALTEAIQNASAYATGPSVFVRINHGANGTVFSVVNEGLCIEPLDAEEFFCPFLKCDKNANRSTKGLGLGLPIARLYAEQFSATTELLPLDDRSGMEFRLIVPGISTD
ncbi:MAG: ATP-binding protein [Pseudomonadota bacterium]